jgi:ribonuclease HII
MSPRRGPKLFDVGERVPDLNEEKRARKLGFKNIAGVDEAGRGPLAGPVVAAAVILPRSIPKQSKLWQIRDSKKLSAKLRDELYDLIKSKAIAVGVGEASHEDIDRFNIFKASLMAMHRAVDSLAVAPDFCLIDGLHPLPYPASKAIVKGDLICMSIAAASIIAKVERDRMMDELAKQYPFYNFEKNKGYATADHRQALYLYGPCAIHRMSYEPVKVCLRSKS